MENERGFLYNNYIKTLQEKFIRRLSDIQADYNFDHGDEFEIAVCDILRSFLPIKYGICRGHAVQADGSSAGDDIIVYDQERFPTLKVLTRDRFDRKENIPIEAVYAYIEVKHTLDISTNSASNFHKAIDQVKAVKVLCGNRPKTSYFQWDPYISVADEQQLEHQGFPSYRNPIFGIILSRFVAIGSNKIDDPGKINIALSQSGINVDGFGPDLVVVGGSNFLSPAFQDEMGLAPTLFLRSDKHFGLQYFDRPNIAFGVFLAQLAFAIDWIKLGRMPWGDIVNNAIYGTTKGQPWQ